jgi:dTDP-4-dehydrorhamnose 3,5-epimerase
MRMTVEAEYFGGAVKVIGLESYEDARGFFMEVFRADQFAALGLPVSFPQDSHSGSVRGVLRGMHFQWDPPQGKLIRITRGSVYLAIVDIRLGSPTAGTSIGLELSARERRHIWAPPGFANGFVVLSDEAEVQYKHTTLYNHAGESNIRWNDPELAIPWPVAEPLVSTRDANAPTLAQWLSSPAARNLPYSG